MFGWTRRILDEDLTAEGDRPITKTHTVFGQPPMIRRPITLGADGTDIFYIFSNPTSYTIRIKNSHEISRYYIDLDQ